MSALDTNIIDGARVKEITGKAQGIEDRKLDPAIHMAQHALEQVTGTTLYAIVEAAYPTYAGDYVTLYEQFIEPFLAWKTLEEVYPDLYAEADRNGVFTKSGNEYSTVSASALNVLIGKVASRADVFQQAMLKWLRNLDSSNAIKVAFDTDVDCEPRTKKTYRGRTVTRISRWQYEGGNRWPHRDPNHCHDEC